MSIEVQQLTKIYGQQKAVDGISFSVDKGQIVGFLGPNGAGKSTTMKIITGYLTADNGEAIVCGIPVQKDPQAVKSKIGYLPESNPLYYDMYVREYLDFMASVHHIKSKKEAIEKAIDQVGLRKEAAKKIGQLSKGYKQRVGLAAALIHDPEVLILDEPTTGLDPNQIIEIREVIKELGKNKTVLFSSHILQEVEAICNRIIIINKGKIVADNQLNDLLQHATNNSLIVEFKEKVDAGLFASIPSIQQLNDHSWSATAEDADALRRTFMEIALQHGLNIISMRSESQASLESIFRELTNQSATPS